MLNVRGINQFYGSSHTLRNVSFSADVGAVTTVLGRNGVGKTTLLKCLMGSLATTSGSIHINGADVTGQPAHARARSGVGYVPQGREIFARLTVEENLLMGLATKSKGSIDDLPSEIFDMFPVLNDMLHRRGGDLSGGQQQQLAIGRALSMSPRILLLDEPTEGIQPSIIKDIGSAIKTLAKRGDMAIVLVEQYYEFAKDLADQYIVLQRGEIIKSGAGSSMGCDDVRQYLAV